LTETPIAALPQGLETGKPASGPALRFAFTAFGIGLTLFAVFRIPWVQRELLIPYARAQQVVAGALTGLEKLPVVVNFSCTGADVIALCLATVLAFPAPWRRRLGGAGLGLLLITAVNTVRIGSLSLVFQDKKLFDTLHEVVWPAILIVVVSLYVFQWMRTANRRPAGALPVEHGAPASAERPVLLRFALWLLPLVVVYLAASSWYLESAWMEEATRWTALAGAALFALFGAAATVAGSALSTAHGSFLVTPDCIASPLVPVYYAAVLALPASPARRAAGLLAGPLVFFALGTLRLLVLALPAALVPSYMSAIHAFNQIAFAALLVLVAAFRGPGRSAAAGVAQPLRRGAGALLLGSAAGVAAGIPWTRLLDLAMSVAQRLLGHAGHRFADEQSATTLLPAFQLGFFAALLVAWFPSAARPWRRSALALAVLLVAQLAFYLGAGELKAHLALEIHVRDVRAWSVLAPLLAVWWVDGRRPRWPAWRRAAARPAVGSA
jgi:exosortase/archaeosortase family protein